MKKILSRLVGSPKVQIPQFVPPGHYYSPIPSPEEIRKDEDRIFGKPSRQVSGIEMNEKQQVQLLQKFKEYYDGIPFESGKKPGLRYYFDNRMYSYSDAIFLYCMIRHLTPKNIIEVGSGFSSCVTLDTNEKYFDHSIKVTFIEPYPERLLSLLVPEDRERITILPNRLQDVDLEVFDFLGANDILFLDSTHVSKVGSDVNRIFFEILPRLAPGVHIHFHDIFYPFEYPKDWIYSGRAWNEAYLLKAFLQYNHSFRIVLMNTYLHRYHQDFFNSNMPLCLKNTGASIWIKKT